MGATVLSYPGDSIPKQSSFKGLTYLPAEFLGRLDGKLKLPLSLSSSPFSSFFKSLAWCWEKSSNGTAGQSLY